MDGRQKRLIALAAVLCAGVIFVYPLALRTPLLDPDEGLHAAISQGMVESGDYVMPRFLGQPFLDKPILYFCAQALSLRSLGMNEVAARLPGLMFGLFGAATTGILAWRLYDRETGLLAVLVSVTSIVPLALAQAAAHDVALVPWTNLLLLCWWAATHENSAYRRAAWTLAAAVFASLALLTKGLIGVAVVLIGFSLFVVISRQSVMRFAVCAAASLSAGLILASPWFIEMELRSPGYLYYYFVERHVMGFATHTQKHGREPWYFYVPLLLGGTAPWVLFIFPSLRQEWRDHRTRWAHMSEPTLFTICWLLGGLGFLSVAKSKLITYALPLYPAIAILAAHGCKQFLSDELSPNLERICERILRICCLIGLFFPFGLLIAIDRHDHNHSPPVAFLAAGVATATSIVGWQLIRRRHRAAAVAMCSLWFPLLFFTLMTWPMQTFAENWSQRQLAYEVRILAPFPKHILVGTRVASFVFYLTPDERRRLRPNQIVEIDPAAFDQWSMFPPQSIVAIRTGATIHCASGPLPANVHQLPSAGDYRVLEIDDMPTAQREASK